MMSVFRTVATVVLSSVVAACTTAATVPDQTRVPQTGASQTSETVSQSDLLPIAYAGTPVARAPAEIVIDVGSGAVLHQDRADGSRYPASLAKLMTLYILFEEINAGRLSMDSLLTASAKAAARPAAKIGLSEGDSLPVRTAIRALIVKSANDVATMVAENISGSEEAFANRMTRTARSLGMGSTRFVNASGLPEEGQVTTARDIARLAVALRTRHRAYVTYFATREFDYSGRNYKSTNKLLGKVAGVNGMKTGYIRLSGFHLVTSVTRNGRELIIVVLGGESSRARDETVEALVEQYS